MNKIEKDNLTIFNKSQNPNFSWGAYGVMLQEKRDIFQLIEKFSHELSSIKQVNSVLLNAQDGNICDIDSSKDLFNKKVKSKQQEWFNKLKKYYMVQYHSRDFQEYIDSGHKLDEDKKEIQAKIAIQAWESLKGTYFEWIVSLYLLRFLINATNNIDLSINKCAPIAINQNSPTRFLWYQKSFSKKNGLNTRPDFMVSDSKIISDSKNIIGIIECKYLDKPITSSNIRDIFSKGYELRPHYLWLFSMSKLNLKRKKIIEEYGINVLDEFRLYIDKDLISKNNFEEQLIKSTKFRPFISKIIQDALDKVNR